MPQNNSNQSSLNLGLGDTTQGESPVVLAQSMMGGGRGRQNFQGQQDYNDYGMPMMNGYGYNASHMGFYPGSGALGGGITGAITVILLWAVLIMLIVTLAKWAFGKKHCCHHNPEKHGGHGGTEK